MRSRDLVSVQLIACPEACADGKDRHLANDIWQASFCIEGSLEKGGWNPKSRKVEESRKGPYERTSRIERDNVLLRPCDKLHDPFVQLSEFWAKRFRGKRR